MNKDVYTDLRWRIYLAAPWVDRLKMDAYAQFFENYEYVITHKWWKYEGDGNDTPTFLTKCAEDDLEGVSSADALIMFSTGKSEGKAVEQGIAIAQGIPIIAIGKRGEFSNNVFHYLPDYTWVTSKTEALHALKEIVHG